MKRWRFWIILAAVAAILAIVKVVYIPRPVVAAASAPNSKGSAPAPSANVQVWVAKPEHLDNDIFVTGTLLPNEEVELHPEVAGRVVTLTIREGSKVAKGDLLLTLNAADLQAQARKTELLIKNAEERAERGRKLIAANGMSQQDYEALVNAVETLRAEREYTQAQIAKTELRAPFAGVVGFRYISDGAYLTPATRVATIQQIDPIKVEFSVPEKYADRLRVGSTFEFSTSLDAIKRTGKVYAIEPRIDANTRTVVLRATASNAGGKLVAGAFARISLPLTTENGALLVPSEAVVPELKGKKLWLVRNGKAVGTPIQTGVRTETKVQVIEGLHAGDSVIVSGVMGIRNDMQVSVAK